MKTELSAPTPMSSAAPRTSLQAPLEYFKILFELFTVQATIELALILLALLPSPSSALIVAGLSLVDSFVQLEAVYEYMWEFRLDTFQSLSSGLIEMSLAPPVSATADQFSPSASPL